MRIGYLRCTHCGRQYRYQFSGEGCFNQVADDRYCDVCKAIIIDTLRQNVCKRWVPIYVKASEEEIKIIKQYLETEKKEKLEYRENYFNKYGVYPFPSTTLDFAGNRKITVKGKTFIVDTGGFASLLLKEDKEPKYFVKKYKDTFFNIIEEEF